MENYMNDSRSCDELNLLPVEICYEKYSCGTSGHVPERYRVKTTAIS